MYILVPVRTNGTGYVFKEGKLLLFKLQNLILQLLAVPHCMDLFPKQIKQNQRNNCRKPRATFHARVPLLEAWAEKNQAPKGTISVYMHTSPSKSSRNFKCPFLCLVLVGFVGFFGVGVVCYKGGEIIHMLSMQG